VGQNVSRGNHRKEKANDFRRVGLQAIISKRSEEEWTQARERREGKTISSIVFWKGGERGWLSPVRRKKKLGSRPGIGIGLEKELEGKFKKPADVYWYTQARNFRNREDRKSRKIL